jgi:hypothetical protein
VEMRVVATMMKAKKLNKTGSSGGPGSDGSGFRR